MDMDGKIPQYITDDFKVHIINKMYKDTVRITAVKDGVILFYGLRRWIQNTSNRSRRLQMRSLNFTVKEGNTKVTLCSVTPAERS